MGHHILYILHTSTPVEVTVSQTGIAFPIPPHKNNFNSGQAHLMDPKIHHQENHPEVVFQVIVAILTGHCDLSEMINPNPAWLPSQNCGISFWSIGWILNPLGSEQLWPPYTQHPSHPGACISSPLPEGQVPFSYSWSNYFNHTCPCNSISSIVLPASEPYNKQTSSYPELQSLDAKPWHTVTMCNPYNSSTSWETKTMYEMILKAVWMKLWHNF